MHPDGAWAGQAGKVGVARSEVADARRTTQRFTGLPVNRYITIVEGEEKWK